MIEVRLFATLPMHSTTGRREFQLAPRPGLTVLGVIQAEGLSADEIHIILINGAPGTLDSQLNDGDRLAVFPPVGGG
jgi:molybdopterin converting factor small subunit